MYLPLLANKIARLFHPEPGRYLCRFQAFETQGFNGECTFSHLAESLHFAGQGWPKGVGDLVL